MGRSAKMFVSIVLAEGLVLAPLLYAGAPQQDQQSQSDKKQSDQDAKQAAKERKQKEKDLFKELDSQYKKWLNEDVVYIISPEERSAFVHLQTNEEREQFIEQFWQRRNPDPDSAENTFKEEH